MSERADPTPAGITREQARAIAEAYRSRSTAGPGSARIGQVLAFEELRHRAPVIYDLGVPLESCWIAYIDTPVIGLRSSDIILVSRLSGDVVYAGSAHDEG